jgi:acetyltransferase-like isoleucine patch superfamily enzyme
LSGNKIRVGKISQAIGLQTKRLHKNNIVLYGESKLIIEDEVELKECEIKLVDSKLCIKKGSQLDNVKLEMVSSNCEFFEKVSVVHYNISIIKGQLSVGNCTKMKREEPFRSNISIDNGKLSLGNNNVIQCDFSVRFGGICSIGQFNCINEGSELRCDNSLSIGDYNMISYNCNIWDTNTHTMNGARYRRSLLLEYSSNIGAEKASPKTKPVKIGNDCWLGKNVSILKGTNIEDESIIGLGSILSNQIIKKGQIIVPHKAIVVER